ncbi:MAG: DUF349 domain-containing protein [Flavobacteriaceae bacterium]|jgi:hypothetical protein|nr:DUF349 domain-containing protein [Flavobacteriaceae bacterium]
MITENNFSENEEVTPTSEEKNDVRDTSFEIRDSSSDSEIRDEETEIIHEEIADEISDEIQDEVRDTSSDSEIRDEETEPIAENIETEVINEINNEEIANEIVNDETEPIAEEIINENSEEIIPENLETATEAINEIQDEVRDASSEIRDEETEPIAEEIINENSEEIIPENVETTTEIINEINNENLEETENIHSELPHFPPSGDRGLDRGLDLESLVSEMEKIVEKPNGGSEYRAFTELKNLAILKINQEREIAEQVRNDGSENDEEEREIAGQARNDDWEHPLQQKINTLSNLFKEKNDAFLKNQEIEQAKNMEIRQSIVERLKNLYTNTEIGTNLFKEIRKIRDEWKNAGQVAKSEFKLLNNNYFHHLKMFYQMLDLNKEYLEQEYTHNLETRQHIIERAKELEDEPSVQKALNELQYLHKLWKEEAEPVAEEFREKTWDEFKAISDRIHSRKSELNAQIAAEQTANLEKKTSILETIKNIINPEKEVGHSYWQNAIRKVEDLRTEFLKTGSVPKKLSNRNWNEFKTILREFNSKKNDFYKNLKGVQITNLEEKQKLIQTAKDNMYSEDWETAVPLFKQLQEKWRATGHVPKNLTNKVWSEFRDACNIFFNNFREKNQVPNDNWKENYKQKRKILDELKNVTDEEGSVEKIEALKTAWNNTGKVPRSKMDINLEFNKTLKEKLVLNKINEFDLREEGLSGDQLTDKARKIKNQISDLEAEVSKLENNLGFFSNSTKENPLLKDTFKKIDDKKSQIESLKATLHHIISG